MFDDIPQLALSVRQPWAWAIVAGHKVIENRSPGAVQTGNMGPGTIAIHAAAGMTEKEYDWAVWRLQRHGVTCPRPDDLVRRAIIGWVTVTDIVDESDSPWFGGPRGLVLENAVEIAPVPAPGALGYFRWQAEGDVAKPKPWMLKWDRPSGDNLTGDLFPEDPQSYRQPPRKPWSA
ncbi:MAG: hypothetical protein AAGO57_00700 [Pseudomonadota bacterium]